MAIPPAPPAGGTLPGPPFPWQPPDHPQAMTVLILGILGLSMVPFTAPFAWYLGSQALREIDAEPGRYGRRDWVSVGRLLGIVGTIVLGVMVIVFAGFFVTWAMTFAMVGSSM